MFRKPVRKILIIASVAIVVGGIAVGVIHNVPKTITKEDIEYIDKILKSQNKDWNDIKKQTDYNDEIDDIRAIQQAVLGLTPIQKQIPSFRKREPKDLYTLRYAQCSDRSRVMDKMLRLAGFNARIASVYATDKTGSAIKSLLTTNKDLVRSHSMVEVETSQGWMMVDTNDLWLGLKKDMSPISLEEWQIQASDLSSFWHESNTGDIYPLMTKPYTYVYGLYSRHGYFYPPYNPIPDLNWKELLENL